LPYLVALFAAPDEKNSMLALVRVVGLAVAMLVQPLAGMLSDRSTSKWGRRRPFIAAGALLNVAFLTILLWSARLDPGLTWAGASAALLALLAGIALLQASSNMAQGALQGLIPDVAPEPRRGRASGFKAVFELLPILLVIFIGPLVDAGRIGLVVGIIMAGFLVTMLITVLFVHEEPLRVKPAGGLREPVLRLVGLTALFLATTQTMTWLLRRIGERMAGNGAALPAQVLVVGAAGLAAMAGAIFIGVYYGARLGIGPEAKEEPSFIWWVVNRLMFLAAVGSIQGFAQFYLADVLGIENAATMTSILLAVVAAFLLPAALGGGYLSDRFGRKRLVGLAGLIAAAGTFPLLLARSVPAVLACGGVIGLATGLFMATSWALGTDLSPRRKAGLYLGISNLAGAGAGIVGAGIGGPIADSFNRLQPGLGYLVIFGIYGTLFLLSVLALRHVRS
jgi:MFS family permease